MAILDNIKTIILLMFENRSFDHMLGHLSIDLGRTDINGLKDPLSAYNNIYKGDPYPLYPMRGDAALPNDIPHEWNDIAMQIAWNDISGQFTMGGFVKSYAQDPTVHINAESEPMGYLKSDQVPMTSFLAQNFCTCDNWFASLPTSTHPNRTMAFCGDSSIFETKFLIDMNTSIFEWMEHHRISWKVYHDGLSFFALYKNLWQYLFDGRFKDYESFFADISQDPAGDDPQIIIVEPSYYSAPHIGSDRPNDNHAPLAIGWGEEFLRRTYEAVIANKKRWEQTLLVVYYDENGGFNDHVPPPLIPYTTTGNPSHTFNSLGVRVPGILVSPYIKQSSVSDALFDHTSVLQLLAEKFTPGIPFSNTVNTRKNQGILSLSDALTNDTVWDPPVPPSVPIPVSTALGQTILTGPHDTISEAFANAANELIVNKHEDMAATYPDILQWKNSVDNAKKT